MLSAPTCLQFVARANPRTVDEMLVIADLSQWLASEFGSEWVEAMGKA